MSGLAQYALKKGTEHFMHDPQMAEAINGVIGQYDPMYVKNEKGKRVLRPVAPYIPKEDADRLLSIRKWARKLNQNHSFCGLKWGWSSIIGLLPVVGDSADVVLACIMYRRCRKVKNGLSTSTKYKMKFWIVLCGGIGFVPVVGDYADTLMKPNVRLCQLLEKELEHQYNPVKVAQRLAKGEKELFRMSKEEKKEAKKAKKAAKQAKKDQKNGVILPTAPQMQQQQQQQQFNQQQQQQQHAPLQSQSQTSLPPPGGLRQQYSQQLQQQATKQAKQFALSQLQQQQSRSRDPSPALFQSHSQPAAPTPTLRQQASQQLQNQASQQLRNQVTRHLTPQNSQQPRQQQQQSLTAQAPNQGGFISTPQALQGQSGQWQLPFRR